MASTSVPIKHQSARCGSILRGSFSHIKLAVGAGILYLPHAFEQATPLQAILFLFIGAILCGSSLILLGYLSKITQSNCWGEIWKNVFHQNTNTNDTHWLKSGKLIDFFIATYCFTDSIMYLIIANTNISQFIETYFNLEIDEYNSNISNSMTQNQWLARNPSTWKRRQYTTIFIVLFIMIPMCYINIKRLSYASFFGLCTVVLLISTISMLKPVENIHELSIKELHEDTAINYYESALSTLAIIGSMVISMATHLIAPEQYQSLEDKSLRNYTIVAVISMCIVFVLNVIVGTMGYYNHYQPNNEIPANVLQVYTTDGYTDMSLFWVSSSRICVAVSVIINHVFLARTAAISYVNNQEWIKYDMLKIKDQTKICVIYTMIVGVVGLNIPELQTVTELSSSLFATGVTMTFPGIMLYVLLENNKAIYSLSKWCYAVFLIVCGVAIFFAFCYVNLSVK
eukprot:318774_1